MNTSALTHEINDLSSARAIAISAGDVSVTVKREVERLLKTNKNNFPRTINAGLKELSERELISEKEVADLGKICKHLLDAIKEKEHGEDAFFSIRRIYHGMIADKDCSPVALSIASVVNSSFEYEKSNSVKITPGTTGAGAAAGALLGAGIGATVGGPLGGALGGLIGGAAGGAIGLCNETGN